MLKAVLQSSNVLRWGITYILGRVFGICYQIYMYIITPWDHHCFKFFTHTHSKRLHVYWLRKWHRWIWCFTYIHTYINTYIHTYMYIITPWDHAWPTRIDTYTCMHTADGGSVSLWNELSTFSEPRLLGGVELNVQVCLSHMILHSGNYWRTLSHP
jgi:hypothetical protein